MNYVYHPISGVKIMVEDLDGQSAFIEDRLFKPEVWNKFFYDENDKNNITYGIEIELNTSVDDLTENHKRIEICIELLSVLNRDGKHFHIMRDNSVRSGIELVSAPMTYKYWIETFDVKEINDLFDRLHLSATIDTGLHIHAGVRHTTRIRELYLQLFAISYPMWINLSDRRYKRVQDRYVSTQYFYSKPELKTRLDKTLKSLLKTGTSKVNYKNVTYYDYQYSDRYVGLNFFNESTIEFRMFSGTDNFFDIIKYLTLVDVICKMASEISVTRVNDVYDLDTFVKRTKSELMLEETVRHIRFINMVENKDRIYNNHFMFLDTYWYKSPVINAKRKDLVLSHHIYKEYLSLLDAYHESDNHQERVDYKKDIDVLLLNNISEVVKVDDDIIYTIKVRGSTKRMHIHKVVSNNDVVFLRGVSETLIIK